MNEGIARYGRHCSALFFSSSFFWAGWGPANPYIQYLILNPLQWTRSRLMICCREKTCDGICGVVCATPEPYMIASYGRQAESVYLISCASVVFSTSAVAAIGHQGNPPFVTVTKRHAGILQYQRRSLPYVLTIGGCMQSGAAPVSRQLCIKGRPWHWGCH